MLLVFVLGRLRRFGRGLLVGHGSSLAGARLVHSLVAGRGRLLVPALLLGGPVLLDLRVGVLVFLTESIRLSSLLQQHLAQPLLVFLKESRS